MTYSVFFTDAAKKALKKLDNFSAKKIISWIRKNLENCTNPRLYGKGLTGDHSGQWRYRVGDYRIISKIIDNKVIIEIISIGHRREVYR